MIKPTKKTKLETKATITAVNKSSTTPAKSSSGIPPVLPVPPKITNTQPTPIQTLPPAVQPPKANRVAVEFLKIDAKTVCIAGSFNEWKPENAPLTSAGNGRWIGNLSVNPGRHEYLFVVDGQWLPDPNAQEYVQNPFGGKNSVLIVSE